MASLCSVTYQPLVGGLGDCLCLGVQVIALLPYPLLSIKLCHSVTKANNDYSPLGVAVILESALC